VTFSNGNVNGLMAMASRPSTVGGIEIETADDFVVGTQTTFGHATFTGLLVGGSAADVAQVAVEIYRVFPLDSNAAATPAVPTRVNSPSDVALDSRDSAANSLQFTVSVLSNSFTAANSVQPGGIHAKPNQTTGGNGAVNGIEVLFDVTFTAGFTLDPSHYFFVPQVALGKGQFYWLSSVRPIVAPGTPFAPDLQAWTRDANLDPDWLRVGTDIVGGTTPPTFNAAFTLDGETVSAVPEPATWALVLPALAVLALRRRKASAFGPRDAHA
jgi:hypothetical protein